jgi:hypothetical protein
MKNLVKNHFFKESSSITHVSFHLTYVQTVHQKTLFVITFNKTQHFNRNTFMEEPLGKPKYRWENNVTINKYSIKRWFRFVSVAAL